MDLEVEKLLRKGAIEEVEPCENQFLSNIFTIPKKGGERRPVVDMRDLNNFIEPVHFKMEDLSHLPSLLRRGDFMCKIDLKDAYQTIPIAKKSRIYLRFLWRGRLYQFTCLPFGLRSSPRIFTKVLKPLLVYLRAMGVRLLVYLDDILIMAATPELCLEHTQLTWQLLTDLGFLGNLKKSVLAPKQQAEYLGFIVNSIEMKLFLTEEKLLRAKLEAERLLKSNPVVKILASFLGFCQSTLPAIAVAPLHFRNLQADMIKALKGSRGGQGYRSVVCLSPKAKKELEWWRDYVKMNNGKSILPPEEQDTIFSDASKQGWGAHLNLAKIGGRWNWEEKLKSHINWLELKAAFLALQAFLPQLKHQHVQIGIDNKTAMTYINKLGGTRSHRLTSLALEMSNFAADRNLTLSAVYVPGEENQIADKKSRVFQDSLEWMLHPAVFQALQKEVGCFSIDLFATRVNHQVPAFVSWRPEPGAVATDAFNVKWDFQLAYLFPPFCMIKRCLRKNSARSGTLCPDHTSVEKQPLVSSHSISVSRATIASAKTAGSSETSRHRKDTPPVPSKKLQAGCMAHFRAKLAKEGFSQKVSDILLSSWRRKTASQYESAWKAWSGWCSEREINPFSTTLENIFEFLADLFHKGFKFRTLGVYRSAISSNHETVDGFVIGKHPMMAKFMKGVFSLRPPEPKYFVTWDVRQVLDFLKTWSPAESLSLKQPTLKLVMLAALITAARSSSVNKMNLCFRYFKPHGVLFKVPGLTKCAGPKRPLQNLFLASFPPDRRLCFVNYLKQYEKVTKNL